MAIDPDIQPFLDDLDARVAALEAAPTGGIPGVWCVTDYGATGDGATDDRAAIQTALDAVDPNRGGIVWFPQGRYRVAAGLTVTKQGTVLVGGGKGGIRAGAKGSARIVSDNGVTAVTFNPAGTPHLTLGFGMRDLHVIAADGATSGNGVLVKNCEAFTAYGLGVSGYKAGYGLKIGEAGTNSQYAELHGFCAGDCLTGLHLGGAGTAPNGVRLFGGYFEGTVPTPQPGTTGILVEAGDTLRLFGTAIQGWAVGVDLMLNGGHELHGPRFEFCTVGLNVRAGCRGVALEGGSFVSGGAGSTGIVVEAGAQKVYLRPSWIENVGTTFQNGAPPETMIVYPGHAGWHPSQ